MKSNMICQIERGEIISSEEDGYKIASLDRTGIETPPLHPIDENVTYSVGDQVYYFFFHDGTGKIISKL